MIAYRDNFGPVLRASPELLALLRRAAAHKMTPEEKRSQRRSFVYGQMMGRVSREDVDRILSEMGQ